MGIKSCLGGTMTGSVVGAGLFGSLGAAGGAASGAVGAAVLDAAGHAGYVVSEATKMGAIGGAILNGTTGVIIGGCVGALASVGFFSDNSRDDDRSSRNSGSCITSAISYTASMTLGGLIGWGVMNAGDLETVMDLGRTAASLAVGGAITAIPMSCAITCVAIPLVLCAAACVAAFDQKNENTEELRTAPSPA